MAKFPKRFDDIIEKNQPEWYRKIKKEKRKVTCCGYTTKDWDMLFTIFNTLNISCVIQKTREEAMARYNDDSLGGQNIRKLKVTIEEI
jgi:hypothetical protein